MSTVVRRGVATSVAFIVTLAAGGCTNAVPANVPRVYTINNPSRGAESAPTQSGDLLYVSDYGAGRVDVYAYAPPSLRHVESLRRPLHPSGSCVDSSGDVFVTDYAYFKSGRTVEYAHGAIAPTRTLRGATGHPSSCAVDPTTGNLAVASNTANGENTDVAIYSGATGAPTLYQSPDMLVMSGCTYDGNGNLYVAGVDYAGATIFNELVRGGTALVDFTIEPAFDGSVGDVQWLQDRLVLSESIYGDATIDRYAVSGNTARLSSSMTLDGANAVGKFDIVGRTIATVILPKGQENSVVAIFRYPRGGAAIATLSTFADAAGVVVSPSGDRNALDVRGRSGRCRESKRRTPITLVRAIARPLRPRSGRKKPIAGEDRRR